MKKIILIVNIALVLFNSCDSSTEYIENTTPGRRDYTWTVDTLGGINSPRGKMWGSSPTDIWATSTSAWEYSISHFDGYNWSSYGIQGIINPSAIYGFSKNNIFIGSENGNIWHYDGVGWKKFAEITKDGHQDIVLGNIWGENSNDFYVFGAYPDSIGAYNKSVIALYKDYNWNILTSDGLIGIVGNLFENTLENKVYLNTYRISGGQYYDSTLIFEYNQIKYQQLYSSVWTKGLQADISFINNEVIFVLGNKVAKRVSSQFQTILNVTNPNFYQRIWGRSDKDIFLLMTDGLAHYNGSDVQYLFHFPLANQIPWTQIFGAALFENDVFFSVYEPPTGLSLVYHGKLN